MPAWWPRKSRSKSKAKPGSGPVSAASSPRKSADLLDSPSPSPSPTPRAPVKLRSLDSPRAAAAAAAARARCPAGHGLQVGYKLPVPAPDPETPEPVGTLYEEEVASSAEDSCACSVGSSDEAPDHHVSRSMDPVAFGRGRNMPSDSDRMVNEDKHVMSCSMPRDHQKFFDIPVSSVREHHLHSNEPSTSETSCSRGRTVSEDVFASRTRSLSPVPKCHAFAMSNGNSREFGFSPRSPVRMMDGLRSPPHPLPLPPGSAACSPLPPASAACSPLHPASGACSPRHPAAAAVPPNHSSCSPLPSSPSSCPPLPASPTTFSQSQSQWKKGKLLGSGTFGQVYLGFNSENGQFCAIKEVQVIMDDPHSKERLKQLNQEIDMLRQLSHPNIVQYHGSDLTDDALSIYLEYVSGGSIHKLLREYGPFKEPVIRNYTGQILAGLAYLHGRNTVHRDIKGANILVGPNGEVKLADFGMAKHSPEPCRSWRPALCARPHPPPAPPSVAAQVSAPAATLLASLTPAADATLRLRARLRARRRAGRRGSGAAAGAGLRGPDPASRRRGRAARPRSGEPPQGQGGAASIRRATAGAGAKVRLPKLDVALAFP